ncbi:MAG: rhomboid family intrarane serine protease [Caulobacteraceae bacterium]|nr:rhomboid family intrarane serine protease [Caulobacteraceae bacterium]
MSLIDAPPAPDRRLFKADASVLLIAGVIVASIPVQAYLLPDSWRDGALSAQAIREGRWWTLFTSMFLHMGLLHAGMNAASALALGKATRRFFASGARGAAGFLLFYLSCGLISGLGFVVLHFYNQAGAVGASGAIFGLWGAFARATVWPGEVGPWWSPQMRAQLQGAVVSNLIVVFAGFALAGGLVIAWESHVVGFIAGAVLIGPFTRGFGWRAGPWDLPEPEN